MAYVSKYPEIKIGDKVILMKKVESMMGYFPEGDIVTVCDIDDIRGYGFTDKEGNKVIECGWDCCRKIN